jgi:hypothetical protein
MKISMEKKSREAWPMPFIGPTSGSSGNRSAPYCSISFFSETILVVSDTKKSLSSGSPLSVQNPMFAAGFIGI